MAILNFPDNPQTNDQYTGDNGTTYIFDGVKWVGRASSGVTGTNAITNNGYTVQVDGTGNLVIPVGAVIKDAAGNPVGGSGTGAELIGNGSENKTGYKYTVYGDSSGYQGGENTGGTVMENVSHPYVVGDVVTFRNGEVRTITQIETINPGVTQIIWNLPVDGGDNNPRFPITVQSSNYAPETRSTARIKPDLTEANAHDHYMKVYAGQTYPGPVPRDPDAPAVMDSLHIHMSGAQENVELFLGTDANYVSTKEAGNTPAGVKLHSAVDVSVVDTDLRLDRKGSNWVSVYGDGENVNLRNNTYDVNWNTVAVDEHGDYYVGGEHASYADPIVSKYGRDGDLKWTKYNDSDTFNAWGVGGTAYHNGQVASLLPTGDGRDNDYLKLVVMNSDTGEVISTSDIYDTDGIVRSRSMIYHSTLGWVVAGETYGEVSTTGELADTANPFAFDAIRLLASACQLDGVYPNNYSGWRISGTNIQGSQDLNGGVGYFANRPVTAITGVGVDALANVGIDYNAGTYYLDYVSTQGSGYAVGDTLKVLGSQLGGADGIDDFTFTCGSDGGLTNYYNTAGTPSLQYIFIDMGRMGFSDVAFQGGTFTLTKTKDSRPWVWTSNWTRYLNPVPDATNQYADGRAQCVAEDKWSGGLVIGGRIDNPNDNGRSFVWKLNNEGGSPWVKTIKDDGDGVYGVAVSELDGSIYAATNWNSINKIDSTGNLLRRSEPNGPWGIGNPEVSLAVEDDGVEYVYVGGQGGSIWGNAGGFYLSKLTTDFDTVWGRSLYHYDDNINTDYDYDRTKFVLGRGQASLVGYGRMYSLNNQNGLIYTISTQDQFESWDSNGWTLTQQGLHVWSIATGFTAFDLIGAGASASVATAVTETGTTGLAWNNYEFESKLVNLNATQQGIVGAETIEFADGGTLDHNPSDIPPSIHFDPSNSGWEYTLQLSDRGRFILNQTVPNDSTVQNLTVYVPRNDQVAFPVGTVITLINANSSTAGGNRIHVRPTDWGNGNGWVRIWSTNGSQNSSIWSFQGIQTATLMKISTNAWLLTANDLQDDD